MAASRCSLAPQIYVGVTGFVMAFLYCILYLARVKSVRAPLGMPHGWAAMRSGGAVHGAVCWSLRRHSPG